jgi:AcrR family transcriptional regulator
VPRWPENSRRRLADAALERFAENGYAATTVEDIAEAAGVTSRTFFRYFIDKEEVLFGDADELLPLLLSTIAATVGPERGEAILQRALGALAVAVAPRRDALRRRQRIIDSHISLSGRDLVKQARWQKAVTAALIERGFAVEHSEVLASIGFALFRRSLHAWLEDDAGPTLADRVRESVDRVGTVLATRSEH